jgi:hypothetical protein
MTANPAVNRLANSLALLCCLQAGYLKRSASRAMKNTHKTGKVPHDSSTTQGGAVSIFLCGWRRW